MMNPKLLPLAACLALTGLSTTAAADSDSLTFFESKVRPILIGRCYECHSTDTKQKGGLLLDSRAGWEKGVTTARPSCRGIRFNRCSSRR